MSLQGVELQLICYHVLYDAIFDEVITGCTYESLFAKRVLPWETPEVCIMNNIADQQI